MKTILTIVAALLIMGLGFAWYIGAFITIKIEDKTEGGFKVAGREITGPYSKSGKAIEEICEKLKNMGITSRKDFGIYYDNPKTTPAEKCRSFVGSILEEKDFIKIPELISAGLKIDSVPMANSVVTEFPIKSSLSYMIGPMKAYPSMSKYIEGNNYKVTRSLEVYDMNEEKITFIMQYSK